MNTAGLQFGELRSVLGRGPSPSAWLALCEIMESWPASRFEAELLPYLSVQLARWPDQLCVAPGRWVDALLEGQSAAYLRLIRHLDLRHLELEPQDLVLLDHHEALSSVRILALSHNTIGAAGAQVMARWARLSRSLHTLSLEDCQLGDEGLATLAQAPWLAQLDELELGQNRLTSRGLHDLSKQQWLSLKRIDLSGNLLDQRGLLHLGQAAPILESLKLISARLRPEALSAFGQGFDRLERLELGAMLNDAAMIHWSKVATPPALKTLILRSNRIGPLGAAALAQSAMMQTLIELDLSFNAISDRGVSALSQAAAPALERLGFEGCGIGAGGAKALSQAPWASQVRALDLKRNELGGVGVDVMFSAASFGALEQLLLSSNHVGPRGCRALAMASLPMLKELNIAYNGLGDEGLEALASATWFERLESLRLSGRQMSSAGAAALAKAKAERLKALSFSGGDLGDEGLSQLLCAAWVCGLERLELDDCGIGPAGAVALAQAEHMACLSVLSLRDNQLGARGARALALAKHLAKLEVLDLSNNTIGDEGLEALVEASLWPKLRELRLVAAQITSRGACALAKAAKPFAALEVLDLGSNRIDDEGGQALAHSERLPALRRLELGANALGARGMAALVRAQSLRRLEFLGLVSNPLSPSEARALVQDLWQPSLRRVQLWWNSLGQEGKRVIERATLRANSRKATLMMTS